MVNRSLDVHNNENTPLVVEDGGEAKHTPKYKEGSNRKVGQATVTDTAINVSKVCMGTGILTLPFAASRGGYLEYSLGIILMCIWNLYSVHRVLKCKEIIDDFAIKYEEKHKRKNRNLRSFQIEFQQMPNKFQEELDEDESLDYYSTGNFTPAPDGLSTFSSVAWHAGGYFGVVFLDWIMLVLLVSVVIAYVDAILEFLKPTPFSTGSRAYDSMWTITIIAYLSTLPDVGFLAKFSAGGLAAVLVTCIVIFIYGLESYGMTGFNKEEFSNNMYSFSVSSLTVLFGVIAFSYGLTPITFNVMESMEDPSRMMEATARGLSIASGVYIIVGISLAMLFSPDDADFQGDALQQLPNDKVYAIIVRLAMVLMVIVSTPLLVIPCGELLDSMLLKKNSEDVDTLLSIPLKKVAIRIFICFLSALIAATVPNFVLIVSFIGACFVSFTTFTIPPFLYLALQYKFFGKFVTMNVYLDMFLLVCGIVATLAASFETFDSMMRAINANTV